MENNDKPFVCNAPNCGQRFANSDHLLVHQQKHQLSLNIGMRPGESLIDQTPTPTRFLPKTSEGGELFEGLPEPNPFDQDFKKATPVSPTVPSNTSAPEITILSVSSLAVSSSNQPSVSSTSSASEKPSTASKLQAQNIKLVTAGSELAKKLSTARPAGFTILVAPQKVTQNNQKGTTTTQQPKLILSGKRNAPAIIVSNTSEDMPIHGVKTQASNNQIRSSVPHPAIVTHERQNGNAESSKSTLAKQKLKEILQQNANSTTIVNGQARNVIVTSGQQNFNASFTAASNSSSSPNSSVNSPEAHDYFDDDMDLDIGGSQAKRSRRSQEEMDPDERRKRFLERNRAAASRCRQKRKVWVQQLEKKADDLSATNTTLQGEINHLRTEVAQLKGLLLAHKDCPVTMQQKAIIEHANTAFSQGAENHVISLQQVTENRIETAEEVASSALTDMANQRKIESGKHRLISVISDGNSTTLDTNLNGH